MSKGKVIGSVASLILVVGVVIGVVAVVQHGKQDGKGGATIATSSKTAQAICAPTTHKDACAQSLQSVDKPDATIMDYLGAALNATMVALRKAIDVTNKVEVDPKDDPHNDKMGVDDCKTFLDDAVEQLEASISAVGGAQINNVQERVNEFISWLTGVYIYQETCVDQLEKPEYKTPVKDGMLDAKQLTDNAIFIFSEITKIAGSLNLTAGMDKLHDMADSAKDATSRRLLDHEEAAKTGYPGWVADTDRKLLAAAGGGPPPNAVVAADGSGQFKTVTEAVNSAPAGGPGGPKFVIYVKAGTYKEKILITKKNNVFIYGDGIGVTIITNDSNMGIMGVKTSNTATIGVDADGFMIKGCTIANTAGWEGHQAVALRIAGQNAVVFECSIEGYQDTLYYHRGKQFYKNCKISGTVDFIFGAGRAIIQDSDLIVRKPGPNQGNMVTADGGLTPNGEHGLVLQNCNVLPEPDLATAKAEFESYLGRPWKAYAITIYMQCTIEDFIMREGWSPFAKVGEDARNQFTCTYGEFENKGPGADVTGRAKDTFPKWHVLTPQEAQGYTVGAFIQGASWLGPSGVPYNVGL